MTAYQRLQARFRRWQALGDAEAMLHWDSATMMPAGGAGARKTQIATLRLLRHELLTDPAAADDLAAATTDTDWDRANLREMGRRWHHATALPADLVEAMAHATADCEMAWRTARAADDFAGVAPLLADVVRLTRESAAAKAEALDLAPYDALLDTYEGGLVAATVAPVFDELAGFLPEFLDAAVERQAAAAALPGPFPIVKQQALARRLMLAAGFDFAHGRLDESHHPFTGGVPDDVRITTRYDEDSCLEALLAVLHETGHALYSRHLPADWRDQPVGSSMGMAVHESQSLIVEMQAARTDAYLGYLAGALREAFGAEGTAWSVGNVAALARRVERGLIRVDADEISYPLHILLRFRLEQALLAGDLDVGDLSGAWREGMRDLVGIAPDDDKDGCLQDIHWYSGAFGYFPTYTLGAIGAAQLFETVAAEVDLDPSLAQGDLRPLTAWLAEKIHGRGRLFATAEELLTDVTGRGFDVGCFRRHLERRYGVG
ncbi:MAG: carboxypeptidase M32 [Alphaproteobacteria bacterium]